MSSAAQVQGQERTYGKGSRAKINIAKLQEKTGLPWYTINKALRKMPEEKRPPALPKQIKHAKYEGKFCGLTERAFGSGLVELLKPRYIDPEDTTAEGWIDEYTYQKKKIVHGTWAYLVREWPEVFGSKISRHRFFRWSTGKGKKPCPYLWNSKGESQFVKGLKVTHPIPWNSKQPRVFVISDAKLIVERVGHGAGEPEVDIHGIELVTNDQLQGRFGVSIGWAPHWAKEESKQEHRRGEMALRPAQPVNPNPAYGKGHRWILKDAEDIIDGKEGEYAGSGRGKVPKQRRAILATVARQVIGKILIEYPSSKTKFILKEARRRGVATKLARETLHTWGAAIKGHRYTKHWNLSKNFAKAWFSTPPAPPNGQSDAKATVLANGQNATTTPPKKKQPGPDKKPERTRIEDRCMELTKSMSSKKAAPVIRREFGLEHFTAAMVRARASDARNRNKNAPS